MFVFESEEEVKRFVKDKGEKVTWICANRKLNPDDIESSCEVCGAKVYHRPFAVGRKICVECAKKELGEEKFNEMILEAVKELEKKMRKMMFLPAM